MTSAPLPRILIVDDEAANMRALCETLRDRGYGTEGFTAGKEALGALRERQFDVLLTDLMMPGMDGVAVLTAALEIDPHVVGILMTGKGTIETAVRAMQAGALDYVLKPLKVSALLPVLSRAVAVRRLRLENLELRDTVAIHELNQAIAHTLDPHVLLDHVADAALSQFGADEASVMLLAADGQSLRIAAIRGERRDALLGTHAPIGDGIAGHVATCREPLVLQGEVTDAAVAPLHPRPEIQTALCMPMMTRGKLVGVLNVNYTRRPRAVPPGQIKMLSIFVNAAAAGIEAARLYEEERRTEARYREVLRTAAEGIISIDQDQRIVLFNGAAEKMFGYTSGEVLGKSLAVLIPHELAETHRRHVDAFGRGPDHSKAMAQREPLLGRRKDGTIFSIEVGISKRAESGTVLYTAMVRDVTELLKYEDRIAQLNDELQQAQRMETLGRLAGGVAHDFNNLLLPILAYADMVHDRLPEGDPSREELDEIRKAGESAAALTRQLLAFGRQQVLRPRPLDLNTTIKAMRQLLLQTLGEHIDLRCRLAGDLRKTLIDPSQVEQCLLNLALNSRDAMPDGGFLTIETSNVVLDEAYAHLHVDVTPGSYVQLIVSDSGSGMDEDTRAHIFEPFFTTKPGTGTGLGLASVYGIVKQMHGHIWVYSEPGKGATFKLHFPTTEEEGHASAQGESAVPAAAGGTETVLVVEDHEAVRTVADKVLQRAGYTVLLAATPREALDLSRKYRERVDLLLTDVVLPGMSGREVSRQLLETRPELKVVFMSGYTANAIAHRGTLDADVEFLEKPFTPSALLARVRDVLDRPVT